LVRNDNGESNGIDYDNKSVVCLVALIKNRFRPMSLYIGVLEVLEKHKDIDSYFLDCIIVIAKDLNYLYIALQLLIKPKLKNFYSKFGFIDMPNKNGAMFKVLGQHLREIITDQEVASLVKGFQDGNGHTRKNDDY
jgi:hypothetical protein